MSLLTDEEIGDLLDLEKEKEYPCSVGSVSTVDVDAVVDASQTRTLKAVAEWGNELCAEHQGGSQLRKQCIFCVEGLFLCASEGKMPREAK